MTLNKIKSVVDDILNTPKRGRPPQGKLAGRKVMALTIIHDEGAEGYVHRCFICESERRLINVLASYCRKHWLYPVHPKMPPNDSDVIGMYYEDESDVNFTIQPTYILAP